MIPLTVLCACAGASRLTIKRPVGRHVFHRFGNNISLAGFQKSLTSSTPTMGKQSQIIIFWVVSARPDLGAAKDCPV
jgi:hypothetical protein